MLPWNAVLTALDFFMQSFPSHNPAFIFGLTLNAPNFTFNFIGILLARHIPLKIRFVGGLIVIFCLTLSMPFISNYLEESTAWIIILIIIVVLGVANSFVQGGAFGFASIFPFKCTGGVMLGNGFSGLAMNFFRMLTLAAFPPKDDAEKSDNSAFIGCLIYFAIAALIVICCILGYFWVCKTEYAMFYIQKAGTKVDSEERVIRAASLGSGSFGQPAGRVNGTPNASEQSYNDVTVASPGDQPEPKSFVGVYADVAVLALQVFLCFVITFVVFPGTSLSTKFDFLGNTKKDMAWFSLLMITCFNLFDTIGRFAGGYIQLFTPKTVFILTVVRLIFIPTFVLIQLNANPAWIFQSDWFRILNMALFALTNGYNSTLLMIYGPTLARDVDKERAGLFMSFHLVGGIFIGALIASFAMDKVGV